jgi:hypothetical protein
MGRPANRAQIFLKDAFELYIRSAQAARIPCNVAPRQLISSRPHRARNKSDPDCLAAIWCKGKALIGANAWITRRKSVRGRSGFHLAGACRNRTYQSPCDDLSGFEDRANHQIRTLPRLRNVLILQGFWDTSLTLPGLKVRLLVTFRSPAPTQRPSRPVPWQSGAQRRAWLQPRPVGTASNGCTSPS